MNVKLVYSDYNKNEMLTKKTGYNGSKQSFKIETVHAMGGGENENKIDEKMRRLLRKI